MKILIIQLARLGDIYLTWPAINAFKKQNPDSQIDLLTRSLFSDAAIGLNAINKVHCLPTKAILSPLISDFIDYDLSAQLLNKFLNVLKEEKYDLVVNMTFSPFSSYLSHSLEQENTKVIGYTRHNDGYLNIHDDMSAYFYAQVGPGRPNRFHLSDIFASLLQVDISTTDWNVHLKDLPSPSEPVMSLFQLNNWEDNKNIVIQVGASENKKSLSSKFWSLLVTAIQAVRTEKIILIGSNSELRSANDIQELCGSENIINLVGQTRLTDLFHLISKSKLVIGADSVAQHIASLCHTQCLNLSSHSVNFWETGPKSANSYILRFQNETDLNTNELALSVVSILNNEPLSKPFIKTIFDRPSYIADSSVDENFQWSLVKALYLQENFPIIFETDTYIGFERLHEVAVVLFEQYQKITQGLSLDKVRSVIDRGDEIVSVLEKLCPNVGPIVRWYQTEKLRMSSDTEIKVAGRLLDLTQKLLQICELYVETKENYGNVELSK